MAEVTFAKAFLTTLDKRSIKLPADHISDPRKYPNQSPFILPKQSHAFPKKDTAALQAEAQASKSVTITIKPMRGGDTVTLSNISIDQSVHEIKTAYAQKISLSMDKIKLLLNKKPAADLKTLQELGVDGNLEMTAMIMGGAAVESTPMTTKAESTPGVGSTAADKMDLDSNAAHPGSEKARIESEDTREKNGVLHNAEFWQDLEGFLAQRLNDSAEASRLAGIFKNALDKQ